MNVLAFDSCLGAVSAAVRWRGTEGWLVRGAYEQRTAGHAERLLPMISEVMAQAGLDFAGLDRIAVTVGPGTFTGVRSGIAAARAFALATGKPVVAATSLAVMAQRAEEMLTEPLGAHRLMVAVDARRGVLYVQSFGAGLADASEPLLLMPEQAVHSLGGSSGLVVGSGAEAVAAAARGAGSHVEPRFPDLQPDARSLAALAPRLAVVSPVRPLYLRLPDVRPQDDASLPRTHV